jgi:hypothetical protein
MPAVGDDDFVEISVDEDAEESSVEADESDESNESSMQENDVVEVSIVALTHLIETVASIANSSICFRMGLDEQCMLTGVDRAEAQRVLGFNCDATTLLALPILVRNLGTALSDVSAATTVYALTSLHRQQGAMTNRDYMVCACALEAVGLLPDELFESGGEDTAESGDEIIN